MAIISCPECGRQVSDKALKCPQCAYAIGNLEKQESVHLQALQEKIQGVVTNGLTVKVSSVGKSLNIKLTRTPITSVSYDQLWLKISPQLKTDDLKGFSQILISAYSERDINKSEWERQNDIDSKGGIVPNKKDIITGYVFLAILIVGFSSCSYLSNPPRNVQTSSSSSTSSPSNPNTSTSNQPPLPPHTVESRDSLGSNGERIQINSLDPQLSKGDCEKLADNYKPQAGQVSVHKPSLKFKKLFPKATEEEITQPFCVNNLDGKGIFFNDHFF